MSKIRLHGSSSGYTEIAPVAASGNNTLTLPNDGTIISQDSNGAVGVTSITVGTGVTIGDGRVTCSTLHGSAANCTQIPAANIVGLCTAGFERSGGFGGGIEMTQIWRLTSNITAGGSEANITANLSAAATPTGAGSLGSAMTESSGVFTFPSTGLYLIMPYMKCYSLGDSTISNGVGIFLNTSVDSGSSFTRAAYGTQAVPTTYDYASATCAYIFDVTSVSTHKIRFSHSGASGTVIAGNANDNQTHFVFLRLGDT